MAIFDGKSPTSRGCPAEDVPMQHKRVLSVAGAPMFVSRLRFARACRATSAVVNRARSVSVAVAGSLFAGSLAGCIAPSDPLSPGYVVDLSGTLLLRSVMCDGGKALLFQRAAVYPASALRNDATFAGEPVWSATSRRGVGFVILGASTQPGLTIARDHPLNRTTRYLVSYTYVRDLDNVPLDLRVADLGDGMATSALGVGTERDLLRHNPSTFGCP